MIRLRFSDLLKKSFSNKELKINKSYDIVGNIAIIKLPSILSKSDKKIIAEALVSVNKSIKTVLNQVTPIKGELRLRELEWIWGDKKTDTIYHENCCSFKIDVSKAFFSPRLSYERMRIASLAKPNEVVLNMFAGVGCFSIILAKHSKVKKVYSIDINKEAISLMEDNIMLNRVEEKVEAIEGNSQEIIQKNFLNTFDRVLMPLPEKAYDFLETAILSLKSKKGWVHYYDFIHAKKSNEAIEKIQEKVLSKIKGLKLDYEFTSSRVVRSVGPNWMQIVLDIKFY